MSGGTGADVFVYTSGNGNDIITDYSADDGDIIQLGASTAVSDASINGSDYVFTIAKKGSITIKDGASKTITFKNNSGQEFTYQAGTSTNAATFEERWFEEDNNVSESELDSILNDGAAIMSEFNATSTFNTGITNETTELVNVSQEGISRPAIVNKR